MDLQQLRVWPQEAGVVEAIPDGGVSFCLLYRERGGGDRNKGQCLRSISNMLPDWEAGRWRVKNPRMRLEARSGALSWRLDMPLFTGKGKVTTRYRMR